MIGSAIIWINRVKIAFKALSESSKLFSGLSKAMGLPYKSYFLGYSCCGAPCRRFHISFGIQVKILETFGLDYGKESSLLLAQR